MGRNVFLVVDGEHQHIGTVEDLLNLDCPATELRQYIADVLGEIEYGTGDADFAVLGLEVK